MFGFAATTTIFLLAFVLPKFTVIYANKGAALPTPTKILMAMSNFVVGHWLLLLIGTTSLAFGIYFYIRTTGGRRVWAAWAAAAGLAGRATWGESQRRSAAAGGSTCHGGHPGHQPPS